MVSQHSRVWQRGYFAEHINRHIPLHERLDGIAQVELQHEKDNDGNARGEADACQHEQPVRIPHPRGIDKPLLYHAYPTS